MTSKAMRSALSVLSAVAAASACAGAPETGVELSVTADEPLEALRLSARSEVDGALEPVTLPESPRELDPAGETVLLLFDEALGGTALELRVSGLRAGLAVVEATTTVRLAAGRLVRAHVHLGARAEACEGEGCGETCAAGGCEPGQRCVEDRCVCDASSCPTGCCQGESCRTGDSDEACGQGGAPCRECARDEECEDRRCVED